MRKSGWILVLLLIIGFLVGNLLGTYFGNSFFSYGANFGLENPVELNLGFINLVFGIKFNVTIAGVIGLLVAFLVYKFTVK
ncbi:MAG: DUF4321 domain-containing protein [Lachnospiraceae bacterium]|nr:DUF4321 domain-containing protein [Lachnospiraceae bacterium]